MAKNNDWPEEGELLVCTVKNVRENGAYLNLDSYEGKEGFVFIGEVSAGWVKNIRSHVREGQRVVAKVIEVKKENLSKGFWSTSSFMASYYNLLNTTSSWLTSKGVKKNEAEKYIKELFLALSEDAINKNKTSLKQLVVESQTPGGTNAYVLNELKKKKFYKLQIKVLNSIFKKF